MAHARPGSRKEFRLSGLDPQLAYLALLTRYRLKPLSRWERSLSQADLDVLRSVVPDVRTIRRRTGIGRRVTEVLFTAKSGYADLYQRAFAGMRTRRTPEIVRLEGQIFGYPSCCVESFIEDPYATNDLASHDQEILFHWTCTGCKVTPSLLREYRLVYRECSRIFGQVNDLRTATGPHVLRSMSRVAASIALVAGTSGLAAGQTDPHWLLAPDDLDHDYLSVAEEILRGTDWERFDTDDDTVLDGVHTAQLLSQLLVAPPPGVTITHNPQRGLERCPHCGEILNMGGVTITHDLRGLSVDLPYIALHYLEHGSLGFEGDIHVGRVDLDALKRILMPCNGPHLLTLVFGDDPDHDGLYSTEEIVVGTQPQVADTDGDSVMDGPELAEELITLVSELSREMAEDRPYLRELRMDGLIQCGVCGAQVNMGFVEIVNPMAGISIAMPYLALHSVAHGSFDHTPTDWGKKQVLKTMPRGVLPTVLRAVLTSEGPVHWMPVVGDSDGDGLTDEEESHFLTNDTDPDENGNTIPDGRELAKLYAMQIEALPEGPLPDEPYKISYLMLGTEGCYTCGERWTMGQYEVVNPVAGVSVSVPFYNVHFMKNGSFSSDGISFPRIDPVELAQALGPRATSTPAASSFSFSNAPNPFRAGSATHITLSLPGAEDKIYVAVYDAAGRRVRDLYSGKVISRVMRFDWDGRDDAGRLSSAGVYFCQAEIGDMKLSRKMTLAP